MSGAPAVVLLAFNRPEATRRVMGALRQQRPARLLVAVDGPRREVPEDCAAVAQVREIVDQVDWPCEVSTRFSDTNLGCRYGPESAITWAFEQVDRAVVLEDDCVPTADFFRFSAELLERFADDQRIMGIGGHRWEFPDVAEGPSYFFSRYAATWGWATWADRWRRVDRALSDWPTVRTSRWLADLLADPWATQYWTGVFDQMMEGRDAWDYAVQYSLWRSDGLWVRPSVGMIQNIGFGPDATHTLVSGHPAGRAAGAMAFPLHHPTDRTADRRTDAAIEWVAHSGIRARQLSHAAQMIARRRSTIPEPSGVST